MRVGNTTSHSNGPCTSRRHTIVISFTLIRIPIPKMTMQHKIISVRVSQRPACHKKMQAVRRVCSLAAWTRNQKKGLADQRSAFVVVWLLISTSFLRLAQTAVREQRQRTVSGERMFDPPLQNMLREFDWLAFNTATPILPVSKSSRSAHYILKWATRMA